MRKTKALMDVDDIVNYLGISKHTFYKWRQTKKAPPCFTLPNGELRCEETTFLMWLDRLQRAA